MGDVIDICSRLRIHNLPEVDPDIEITVTMTIGTALAIMDVIDQREEDYLEDEHTPLLHDVYMAMQCEIWPEAE